MSDIFYEVWPSNPSYKPGSLAGIAAKIEQLQTMLNNGTAKNPQRTQEIINNLQGVLQKERAWQEHQAQETSARLRKYYVAAKQK